VLWPFPDTLLYYPFYLLSLADIHISYLFFDLSFGGKFTVCVTVTRDLV